MSASTTIRRMLGEAKTEHNPRADNVLREAGVHDDLDGVRTALAAGADVNSHNGEALCWASYHSNNAMASVLIDAGADVHALNGYPLRLAANHENGALINMLIAAGARWEDVHPRVLAALLSNLRNRRASWVRGMIRAMIPE